MRIVNIQELCYEDANVTGIEVYPEAWTKRREFSLYKNAPRPTSALLFVCSDISVSYHSANGQTVTAGKGDVVYIPKGACYHVTVSDSQSRIDTYTVNFTLRAESELLITDQISILTNRQDNRFELMVEQLREAVYRFEGNLSKRNFFKIKSAFFSLIDAVAGAAGELNDMYYPIRLGVRALRNEWNKNNKIETYAALCNVSPAYFYKCFREWSGKSPVEYRNLLRLTNASAMLRHTDMPVGEIAEIIGFDDAFYFCRVFTKHYGLSPQKYRKSTQNA